MKPYSIQPIKKKSLFAFIPIIAGTITLFFAILTILNSQNIFLCITTQSCMFITFLVAALFTLLDLKKKLLSYFLFGVCIITLITLMSTIFISLKNGTL